jgi:hypothetical protein
LIIQQATACETQTLKDKIRELQQNLDDLKTENLIKENDLARKVQSTELEVSKLQYQVENLNEQVIIFSYSWLIKYYHLIQTYY